MRVDDLEPLLGPEEEVTLTNCDREPIHIPGAIQPYGLLFTVTPDDGLVRQVSASVVTALGRPVEELVGRPVAVLGTPLAEAIAATGKARPRRVSLAGRDWELRVHSSDGLTVCELEPLEGDADAPVVDGVAIEPVEGVSELARHAAEEIRRVSGYDRVMVYRFDEDGHGQVIAEAAAQRLESFLGHNYPSTDIPRQARALYLRQEIRMIVDVDYVPSPVEPADNPLTGAPLDLSLAHLRSVSPIHLEYLRNMGVTATLVISLIEAGELWGLIACHHYSPLHAPRPVRETCQALGRELAVRIREQERREQERRRADLGVLSSQLLRLVDNAPSPADGLQAGEKLLLRLGDADGGSIVTGDRRLTFGVVPSIEDERQIVAMLPADGGPLVMDRLTRDLPFVSHNTDMCGVLALPFGDHAGDYIVWYRDEWVHDLTWAGNPSESLRPDLTSTSVKSLSPRRSFEAWRQAVVGRSQPWEDAEVSTATEFAETLATRL